MSIPRVETDLLIVGTGFAGLRAAISARETGVDRVALVDKASIAMSSQSRLCADVFDYIEMFYNRTRRHSHLGGVSPEAFEAASNRGL